MTEPLTVGTAGHIDHGKTALVRALTGMDTDRLPEERARGMSIALGYARLRLPGGRQLSLVDVPGHERFVSTMVAGATGIDLFLLVVAADDGVMPQTREHLGVLSALEVRAGVTAVTKCDIADPARARAEVADLVAPSVPIVSCAATRGEGVGEVSAALAEVAAGVPSRPTTDGAAVLHVDRVFTVRGAGTVVTGTLWSGTLGPGDRVMLLPSKRVARVRAVHVHDDIRERAGAGQRVAANLAGVSLRAVAPGDVLAGPNAQVTATTILDARLDAPAARHSARVQVHHGTRAVACRLADLGEGFWQLRLETPLLAAEGDRFVVRSIAPPDTLGGGVVLDARARRHGRAAAHRERLAVSSSDTSNVAAPASATPPTGIAGTAAKVSQPLAVAPRPSPRALALAERLKAAGHEPPSRAELGDAAAHLDELRAAGMAVRVARDRYAHPDTIASVRARVEAIVAAEGSVTLARLRDDLGTSRQFAKALLEHLDGARITRRLPDDRRVMRGRARSSDT